MRKQGSCLEKKIMQGTMPGACRRGRPHIAWMDNIKTWTGLPWKSQSEWQRTENRESMSMVWPTLGSRTAKKKKQSLETEWAFLKEWVWKWHVQMQHDWKKFIEFSKANNKLFTDFNSLFYYYLQKWTDWTHSVKTKVKSDASEYTAGCADRQLIQNQNGMTM